jgi:hypothetical protein
MDEAEHGRIRTDPERHDQNADDCRYAIPPQGAQRVQRVPADFLTPTGYPDASRVFFHEREIAELEHGLTTRFGWRYSPIDVVLRLAIDVIANLIVETVQCSRLRLIALTPGSRQ